MVTVRREMEPQPVLAADDGRGEVHASQPGEERERHPPCEPTEQMSYLKPTFKTDRGRSSF